MCIIPKGWRGSTRRGGSPPSMRSPAAVSSWPRTVTATSSNRSLSATPGAITPAAWISTEARSGSRARSTDPTRRRPCFGCNQAKRRIGRSTSMTTSVRWHDAVSTATSSGGRGDRGASTVGPSMVSSWTLASTPAFFVDHQDCQWLGGGHLLCGGVAEVGSGNGPRLAGWPRTARRRHVGDGARGAVPHLLAVRPGRDPQPALGRGARRAIDPARHARRRDQHHPLLRDADLRHHVDDGQPCSTTASSPSVHRPARRRCGRTTWPTPPSCSSRGRTRRIVCRARQRRLGR